MSTVDILGASHGSSHLRIASCRLLSVQVASPLPRATTFLSLLRRKSDYVPLLTDK
nr:hypothetical protein Q903MT_gene1541 [Picea sitchensis]